MRCGALSAWRCSCACRQAEGGPNAKTRHNAVLHERREHRAKQRKQFSVPHEEKVSDAAPLCSDTRLCCA
jgi:hypothetical protein